MFEPHEGSVELGHAFHEAYDWLVQNGPADLATNRGTPFEAKAHVAQKGPCSGEKVIRFMQHETEYARAYECCWGHKCNHNRTLIGMYCIALDAAVA